MMILYEFLSTEGFVVPVGFIKVNVIENDEVISTIRQLRNNKNVAMFTVRKNVAGVSVLRVSSENEVIFEAYDDSRAIVRFETDDADSFPITVIEDLGKEFMVCIVNNPPFGSVIYEAPFAD